MNERENLLRAYTFQGPNRIPVRFVISGAAWQYYGFDTLKKLIKTHPIVFPRSEELLKTGTAPEIPAWQRSQCNYIDSWGCIWRTKLDGITGGVIQHPLINWDAWNTWQPPNPLQQDGWGRVNWDQELLRLDQARQAGQPAWASLRHGFFFQTLTYLRGYEHLIIDMHDGEPRLLDLIATVKAFNRAILCCLLSGSPDIVSFPEDLGMQTGPMLSPAYLRRYLKPVYAELMGLARQHGAVIHMHSDGHILKLADDLIECGVQVLNIQDLVHGIDEIRIHLKGRVAIDLDIDRQQITINGSPGDVFDLVAEAVKKLSSPNGGLSLTYGLYPPTPLENVRALLEALEIYTAK